LNSVQHLQLPQSAPASARRTECWMSGNFFNIISSSNLLMESLSESVLNGCNSLEWFSYRKLGIHFLQVGQGGRRPTQATSTTPQVHGEGDVEEGDAGRVGLEGANAIVMGHHMFTVSSTSAWSTDPRPKPFVTLTDLTKRKPIADNGHGW